MSGLEYLETDPPNAGVPIAWLTGRPLSQSEVYIRSNFPVPEPQGWFEIVEPGTGTRRVTLEDLGRLPRVQRTLVLECAGNGRSRMSPVPEGVRWGLGGASVVTVTGVAVTDVLGPLDEEIMEVVFTGADAGDVVPEGTINYQFSVARAWAAKALLVTHIGEEPLTREHGGPVRVVVPDMYAMASVKWLTRIEGVTTPFSGHFVAKYRYFGDEREPEGSRVERIGIRSIVAAPEEGETVSAGDVTFRGSAWSGHGDISTVVLAVDGEHVAAELEPMGPGVVSWVATKRLEAGRHRLSATATDTNGNSQPAVSRWNANGYANNVVHSVQFDCA